jgi:CHASE2 domain-containing sensor protein
MAGLVLWEAPFGESWINASYDYLFRFGSRSVTNEVVLIGMDNESYDYFKLERGAPWNRSLHAELLRKLAEDNAAMVVIDSFFRGPRDPASDERLETAIRSTDRIVLMAEQASLSHPDFEGARPVLPYTPFLNAAKTNWGVAWLDPDRDSIVRRHWPSPSPGPYPSLPWRAATLAGANLESEQEERWLRYYGREGAWTSVSYRFALSTATNYFRDKTVFIGSQPKTSFAGDEIDEFRTPYSRWTGESSGGVDILITAYL